jgi:hypothetical protein
LTTGGDPRRASLDGAVLEWMREPSWRRDDARFEELALRAFSFQFEHCAPYRRFCQGRSRSPANVEHWLDIPAVPTGAFKEVPLHSFPAERCVRRFRTSGTATAVRGVLHLDTLALYEASALPTFRRHVFPDLGRGERAILRILAPSAGEADDSSLSHMFSLLVAALGADGSGFDVTGGSLQADALFARIEDCCSQDLPVSLCGTSFAFVHLTDELERRGVRYRLPVGSRVMECGGFKGRSREMPRTRLYARIEDALGVPIEMMVNQYGMTELGSQFYDSVLVDPESLRRKLGPPWSRAVIVDSETGQLAADGAVGTVVVFDLANTGSVLAVQTADLGRTVLDGFDVLGRQPGAEERGCSIAVDAMLATTRP